MSRVPRIRFKGFEEDWEQRKLGEVAERLTRKNEKLESILPLTISAQQGLVDQNDFFDKRIASKDVSGYYLIRKGEFAYNKSTSMDAPFGAIKRLDKYGSGVLSTLYIVFKILDDNSTNSDYIVAYYDTNLWHKAIQSIAAEGARNHGLLNIVPNDFFETLLSIPKNISEQKRIGTFVQSLDHLITLHQRKLKKLKNIKKSMLENLFPKNGEKTPRIRFSGFTEDWEQRKLGELATYFEYGLNVAAKEYDGENKYIRITDIDDESHEFRQDNLTSPDTDLSVFDKYKLSDGDLLFSRTGASVGKSYIYKASDGLVYYAGFLIRARIKEENNSEFVYQNTLTSKYVNFIKVTSMRSGQPGVNAQEYSQFEIRVPSKVEQDTITYYFSNLDHLITLHQLEPYYRIFKAIAYRIIDYAEYKFFNVKINLIYDIIRINIA